MDLNFNANERRVLRAMFEIGGSCAPTEIGMKLGYERTRASSRVATAIKALLSKGCLNRHPVSHNHVTYSLTKSVQSIAERLPPLR